MGRKVLLLFLFFMLANAKTFHRKKALQQRSLGDGYEYNGGHGRRLLSTKDESIPETSTFKTGVGQETSKDVIPVGNFVTPLSTQQASIISTEGENLMEVAKVQPTTKYSEEELTTHSYTQTDYHLFNPSTEKSTSNSSPMQLTNVPSKLTFTDDSSLLADNIQPTTVAHDMVVPAKEGDLNHYLQSYSGFLNGEPENTLPDYGREVEKSLYDENQQIYGGKNKNIPFVDGKEFTGHECPPVLPSGSVEWQKGNRVVTAFLPHLEPSICDPPLKCNVSTTVHRHIYLQEGDSLQVMLQRPPHMDPKPISPVIISPHTVRTPILGNISHSVEVSNPSPKKASKEEETKDKNLKTFRSEKVANLGSRRANGSKVDESGKTASSQDKIRRIEREVQTLSEKTSAAVKPEVAPSLLSPLTIWKVTEHEWGSCSTREGGQVGQSEEDGVANISDTFLAAGTQYFIGRSSWSSSECFKLKVVVRPVVCGDGSICSAKGICYANASMEKFSCNCCEGYTGRHCEERDACKALPCMNAGICLDIQEGHDGDTFQCLCPYGYRGRLCETPSSLCDSNPCQNGGFCEGNHTFYSCHCAIGWTGPQCTDEKSEPFGHETTIDDEYEDGIDGSDVKGGCSNGPCIHGVCVETTAQEYRCFCQPGFGGDKCELEYDECYSNPCHNGGTCVDQIGTFQCLCGPGFKGETCLNKVNLCEPDPCPTNKICLDKGNTFSCECLPELTNDDCGDRESICSPNPCGHGGSCYTIAETLSFYCACRPGYTGQTCQGIDRYPLHHHDMAMGKDGLIFDNHKINIYGDASILESVGPYGTGEPEEELGLSHSSLPTSLMHMKNMYTGAVTLASAFLIFLLVVSICHCRVNRPTRNCFLTIPRPTVQRFSTFSRRNSFRDKRRREDSNSLHFDCEHDGASVPMTSHGSSDAVFYNMDVCDNQELPLIK